MLFWELIATAIVYRLSDYFNESSDLSISVIDLLRELRRINRDLLIERILQIHLENDSLRYTRF